MTPDQIHQLLKDDPDWQNPEFNDLKAPFYSLMEDKQYGLDPLLFAWTWYLHGWVDSEAQDLDDDDESEDPKDKMRNH